MITPSIEKLIVKWFTKSATSIELDTLSEWIKTPTNKQMFKDYVFTHYAITFSISNPDPNKIKERLIQEIRKDKSVFYKKRRQSIFKYAAVAVIFLGIGYLYQQGYFSNESNLINTNENGQNVVSNNIVVGTDKAILTLEDGSNITLGKGQSYSANNLNSNGRKLVYNDANIPKPEIAYNYLTIPRGGQFYVKLSDGTEVWLNSESQLKYPVSFIKGALREVELVYGEAYFDVSPSTNHKGSKFKVLTGIQEVEVLGTEFNIKAYKDEAIIYTTLVEGKVTVGDIDHKKTLNPTEQSKLNLISKEIVVTEVDVYSETAWKNGFFSFKGKPLNEIMKVLSRWYDVKVVFTSTEVENVKFNGVISKNEKIEDILQIIKNTNFINDYEITDKNITIK